MDEIKRHVTVKVEYYSGLEEGEDDVGHPYFVAVSDDLHFVTEGDTFEELISNVRECLILTLREGNSVADFGIAPDAQVSIVMDLPRDYAQQIA